MFRLRILPENTSIPFMKERKIAFIISIIVVLTSIGLLFTKGLSFGIDFTGGTIIEIRVDVEKPDLASMRKELNDLEIGSISLQEFGTSQDLLIRMPQQDGGAKAQKLAVEKVRGVLGDEVEYRRIEFVGPQVGKELIRAGVLAMLLAIGGILVYIWFRFEAPFAWAAIIALSHDAIATIGLFSLTQMEFNLSTVAAVLMIAGYSINDTVVVFDRMRENMRKYKKMPMVELIDKSLNETLSRTVLTSVTTLLALGALWFFGGEVIQGFVNALIFGIVIGTHSSIFVAAPMLLLFGVRSKPAKVITDDEAKS